MNILTRSPFWVTDATELTVASAKLEITIAGTLQYTLVKNSTSLVNWDISELLRDYLEIDYDNTNTHSKAVSWTLTWYDGEDATGSVVTSSSDSGFIWDGYGYFTEGRNPTTTRGYLQSNNIIYRLDDSQVKIPVDNANTTFVGFLKDGDLINEETITTSATNNIEYVSSYTLVDTSYDSFKERVEADEGTFEDSLCLDNFLKQFDINEVDEIYVVGTDGVFTIQVKTIEECKYQPMKLTFVNRYGALQDLWFFKKSVESLTTKKEDYNRFNVTTSGFYDTKEHTRQVYNVESQRKLKINTGYVDESYNELMKELMQSEQVWLDIDNDVYPINVDTNSLTFKTSVNDRLVDYSLDISFSYNEINIMR